MGLCQNLVRRWCRVLARRSDLLCRSCEWLVSFLDVRWLMASRPLQGIRPQMYSVEFLWDGSSGFVEAKDVCRVWDLSRRRDRRVRFSFFDRYHYIPAQPHS